MKSETATKFKETEIGPIPEEWDVCKISDVTLLITKGTTPTTIGGNFFDKGIRFIKVENLSDDGKILNDKLTYIDEDTNTLLKRSILQENDLLYSIAGTIGRVAIVTKEFLPGNTNQALAIVRPNLEKINLDYLKYFLISPFVKNMLASKVVQGVQANLSLGEFGDSLLFYPELAVQKQIAEILSSLDDKIDLNRKINVNLEKVASALFKQWFVDFEFPGKDNKPYKSSGGKMVNSELGKIPNGWQVRLMTNYVNIDKGLSYKGSDLSDDGKDLLVGLKCFERGGGFRIDGAKRFVGEFKNQHLLKPGDLIVAMTDLTQGADILGKPAIVPNINNAEHLIASLDVSILRPRTQQISREYLYTLFMRQETQDYLFGYSNGSTVLHLSIKGLNELKLVIAPDDIFRSFNGVIEPIFSQIQVLNNELQDLRIARDYLLPRLMSGRVRVK